MMLHSNLDYPVWHKKPMNMNLPRWTCRLFALAVTGLLLACVTQVFAQANVKNGEYVAKAGGCVGCHTEAKSGSVPFAGGRALATPFGTFYGPNLTPHKETGLGTWSEADFQRAIRHGVRRDGSNYFPAFPYPSFAGMSDNDVRDLWAYLRSLPPTNHANRAHELRFPFGWRFLVTFWKWLYFTPGPLASAPQASAAVNRGAYLVRVLGHCSECHTPRTVLGGPKSDSLFAGAKIAEGRVPNLTPTRLKKWSDANLKEYLLTGQTPGGDIAVEPMIEVVNNTTSQLTAEDLAATIAYLRSLRALPEEKK